MGDYIMMGNKMIAEEKFFTAAKMLEQRDFCAVPSAAELKGQHIFSKKFEAGISEIILSFDASCAKRRTTGRILLIAAIITLLLAFAMSYSALRSQSYKTQILQTVKYTDLALLPVSASDTAEDSVNCSGLISDNQQDYLAPANELLIFYEIPQIPEGYKLHDRVESPTLCMTVYSNEADEMIVFQQCIIDTNFRINTEDAAVSEVVSNGITFYCTDLNGYSTLIWEQEGYSFVLDCPFSSKEAIKIAESIIAR